MRRHEEIAASRQHKKEDELKKKHEAYSVEQLVREQTVPQTVSIGVSFSVRFGGSKKGGAIECEK